MEWSQPDLFDRRSEAVEDLAKKKKRAAWRKWYAHAMKSNPEFRARRLASKKREYQKHRDKYLAWQKAWQKAHPESGRAAWTRWHNRNRDFENARCRERHRRNPEKQSAIKRRSFEKHKAKYRLRILAKTRARQARKRGVTVGTVDYRLVVQEANGRCGICGTEVGSALIHIDHKIPISKGGTHTQENLQLAHGRCNLRKGAKVVG